MINTNSTSINTSYYENSSNTETERARIGTEKAEDFNKKTRDIRNRSHAQLCLSYPVERRPRISQSEFEASYSGGMRNFSDLNLSTIDMSDKNLVECNFEFSNLSHVNFTNARIENCRFSNSSMTAAIFDGTIITGKFNPKMRNVHFKETNKFHECTISGGSSEVIFEGHSSKNNFKQSSLRGSLIECEFINIKFSDTTVKSDFYSMSQGFIQDCQFETPTTKQNFSSVLCSGTTFSDGVPRGVTAIPDPLKPISGESNKLANLKDNKSQIDDMFKAYSQSRNLRQLFKDIEAWALARCSLDDSQKEKVAEVMLKMVDDQIKGAWWGLATTMVGEILELPSMKFGVDFRITHSYADISKNSNDSVLSKVLGCLSYPGGESSDMSAEEKMNVAEAFLFAACKLCDKEIALLLQVEDTEKSPPKYENIWQEVRQLALDYLSGNKIMPTNREDLAVAKETETLRKQVFR